jgi:hypothetical protein
MIIQGIVPKFSENDLLNFIKADFIAAPIIELRRPRGFVCGDLLYVFQNPDPPNMLPMSLSGALASGHVVSA